VGDADEEKVGGLCRKSRAGARWAAGWIGVGGHEGWRVGCLLSFVAAIGGLLGRRWRDTIKYDIVADAPPHFSLARRGATLSSLAAPPWSHSPQRTVPPVRWHPASS